MDSRSPSSSAFLVRSQKNLFKKLRLSLLALLRVPRLARDVHGLISSDIVFMFLSDSSTGQIMVAEVTALTSIVGVHHRIIPVSLECRYCISIIVVTRQNGLPIPIVRRLYSTAFVLIIFSHVSTHVPFAFLGILHTISLSNSSL